MRCFFLVVLAMLTANLAAHADTLSSFDFAATYYGGSATGTVTIDTTTGQATGADILLTDFGSSYEFSGIQNQGVLTPVTAIYLNGPGQFFFDVPGTSLVGYTGGAVCGVNSRTGCYTSSSSWYTSTAEAGPYVDFVLTGSLTPTADRAVTPEPSSVALLGTALLGFAVLAGRQWKMPADRADVLRT